MTRRLCVLAILLCVSRPALAQEAGQTGLTIGFPGAIGMIFHVSEGVAVRPDFTFSRSSSDNGCQAAQQHGVELRRRRQRTFLHRDGARPRWYLLQSSFRLLAFQQRQRRDSATVASTSHSNTYQYSGSFGLQYMPVRRFGVYGEAGVQYSRSDSVFTAGSPSTSSGKSTGSSVGTRAGIGLVWYFD